MNIQEMMKQAKVMQDKMQEMQDKLGEVTVEGVSGGDMVTVTMSCKGDCRSIAIADSMMDLNEKEVLEDLLKAALNDAKLKADQKLADETQTMMGDLGLPAGTKLPF